MDNEYKDRLRAAIRCAEEAEELSRRIRNYFKQVCKIDKKDKRGLIISMRITDLTTSLSEYVSCLMGVAEEINSYHGGE